MGRQIAGFVRVALDLGERLFVILLGAPFILAFVRAARVHPNFILVLLSETLAIVLILTRRRGEIAVRPLAVFAAFAGTALPLLVRPGGTAIAPQLISSILMFSGLSVSILSKLYLNRSFGMIAANRGIKIGGPYRIVRHPMYLGYIVNQLGFLTASFTLANLGIYLAAWSFQLVRVHEEEDVLRSDSSYQQFARRVTARLIPGVY
ncbi:MAG TPA: isoprenylcysteine carboxylmethyltransferase family protein [Sphingomicrobium sp.]|nr:isoprenylcysteine carboxylmethyltransferase family protein [Sphingomicrobium sp.]